MKQSCIKRKSVNYKCVIFVLVIILNSVFVTACGEDEDKDPLLSYSKEELVEMIKIAQNDTDSAWNSYDELEAEKNARIEELEKMLKGIQTSDVETSGIREFNDGTGRLTFTSVDSKVSLPVEFNYPGAVETAGISAVRVSDSVSIFPSGRWVNSVNGATIELYHSTGISFKLSVGFLDREARKLTTDKLEEKMNEFFSNLPPSSIKYSRVYLDDTWFGLDAKTDTFIDEAKSQIRCGWIGYGETAVNYFAVYDGEVDDDKDETILNLINSIQIYTKPIKVS